MTKTVGWLIFSLLHATSCLLWLFQTTQKLPNLHPTSQHSSLNLALPAASQHQQYLSYSKFLDQEPALLSSGLRVACFSSACLSQKWLIGGTRNSSRVCLRIERAYIVLVAGIKMSFKNLCATLQFQNENMVR